MPSHVNCDISDNFLMNNVAFAKFYLHGTVLKMTMRGSNIIDLK